MAESDVEISVTVNGAAGGSVQSTTGGIDRGQDCSDPNTDTPEEPQDSGSTGDGNDCQGTTDGGSGGFGRGCYIHSMR